MAATLYDLIAGGNPGTEPDDKKKIDPKKAKEFFSKYNQLGGASIQDEVKSLEKYSTPSRYFGERVAEDGRGRMKSGKAKEISADNRGLRALVSGKKSAEDIEDYKTNVCIAGVCDVYRSQGYKFGVRDGAEPDEFVYDVNDKGEKGVSFDWNVGFNRNMEKNGMRFLSAEEKAQPGDIVQLWKDNRPIHAMIAVEPGEDGSISAFDNYQMRNFGMRDLRRIPANHVSEGISKGTMKIIRPSDEYVMNSMTPEQRAEYEANNRKYMDTKTKADEYNKRVEAMITELGIPAEMKDKYLKEASLFSKVGGDWKKYMDKTATGTGISNEDYRAALVDFIRTGGQAYKWSGANVYGVGL
jgi:hypothetical protein